MTARYDSPSPEWYEAPEESEYSARRVSDTSGMIETVDEPSTDELEEMVDEGIALATDGCSVEPDGVCPHGAESWLIALGMI